MDPTDFYTGLVARLYAPLRSVDPDPAPDAAFIATAFVFWLSRPEL